MNKEPAPSSLESQVDAVTAYLKDVKGMMGFQKAFRQNVASFPGQEMDPSVIRDTDRDSNVVTVALTRKRLDEIERELETGLRSELPHIVPEAYRYLTSRAVGALLVSSHIVTGHGGKHEMMTIILGTAVASAGFAGRASAYHNVGDIVIAVIAGMISAGVFLRSTQADKQWEQMLLRRNAMQRLFQNEEEREIL
ncbi:MAG: hypothetical protein AAB489_00130 [Patescibacteria group bacterium]